MVIVINTEMERARVVWHQDYRQNGAHVGVGAAIGKRVPHSQLHTRLTLAHTQR